MLLGLAPQATGRRPFRPAWPRGVDHLPYQAILIARAGFANNAHEVAKNLRLHLQTYEQLLRSLVDLRPNLDAAVRAFQGTALERLYVEQDMVFEGDIRPGQTVEPKPLTREVRRWLQEPAGTFLALLGDFGCGKTSFTKRFACELALAAREEMQSGDGSTRVPVLIRFGDGWALYDLIDVPERLSPEKVAAALNPRPKGAPRS